MIDKGLHERLNNVRLLALDVDGVLTDGGVYLLEDGQQLRRFDIKDGLGLKRVLECGIQVVILSTSNVKIVQHRARALGIEDVFLNVVDKKAVLERICQRRDMGLKAVAYMGDDLTDLPVLQAVGFPCAPADAVEAVKEAAVYVTQAAGGRGAVREVCDLLYMRQ